MKDKDAGLMERQMFSEENYGLESSQEPWQQKSQKRIFFDREKIYKLLNLPISLIKSPKFFLILGLIIILIVSFVALVSISTKSDETEQKSSYATIIASPTPQTDPKFEDLKKQVESFNLNLEEIGRETGDLQFPEINLDVKF